MKNGAILLEELITSSDGKYNPFCIFSNKELKKATNNYSYPLNVIKHDAYYILYKGSLQERSISVMKFKDVQDAKQFCFNNIVFAAQMNHKNVVKLIGCCLETQIPILVFESVECKTMSDRIRNEDRSPCNEWTGRLKIAMEIANAVAHVHVGFTRPIVSKSIKLANILFDDECVAKLFDFTLSEVIPEGETHVNN
ncbi:hypothetical protein Dsin_023548 [Dipteronia sinensis]|uniref:Protein kinase domain-containing protein n=1 Tax=Dipteronia sinensis TaxID=43782 RepID=A0AAE0A3T9_9ROSI|nr:hypothetical protein Dsin_023548 [Dipteronia sinensis]